jgi:hypothetical protein
LEKLKEDGVRILRPTNDVDGRRNHPTLEA